MACKTGCGSLSSLSENEWERADRQVKTRAIVSAMGRNGDGIKFRVEKSRSCASEDKAKSVIEKKGRQVADENTKGSCLPVVALWTSCFEP